MGIFDWLFGASKPKTAPEDRIWLTKEAKYAGLKRDVAAAVADPAVLCVIAVAHFSDCLRELQATLADQKSDRVLITGAEALVGTGTRDFTAAENEKILIVVAERHPLPRHDDAVTDFVGKLACPTRLLYYLSLQDALLRFFAGDWLAETLRRFGVKEDESVSARSVSRRIRSAQQKIEKASFCDPQVASAEEWFERNRR